ncbi:thioredoxin family protein [Mongoliitalea daihaiensis]|uniref:thioredoxin family protein n=1 Tax=Mongoliitalea daihaiensis TaxID=2782006 RepID=UPI001F29D096|nr:thioredoxin family protein [Mongoliitalea daihaiensis]UJP63340.1 thioredoxin family protein [Mongoliitalea daihaiensis]
MNTEQYLGYMNSIVQTNLNEQTAPYNKADYLEYTRLNTSRQNRWLKTQTVSEELKSVLSEIKSPQQWLVITEPWCGDAAHVNPFIMLAAQENSLINLTFELRDSVPFSIEKYLTNGAKAIPKLVIRDEHGNDLATWGPRPAGCQALYTELKARNAAFDEVLTAVQNWYNSNKGREIQEELTALLQEVVIKVKDGEMNLI